MEHSQWKFGKFLYFYHPRLMPCSLPFIACEFFFNKGVDWSLAPFVIIHFLANQSTFRHHLILVWYCGTGCILKSGHYVGCPK